MSENGNHPSGTELEPSSGVVEALPGLARVAAGAWIRTAAWGVGKSLELGARVARAATSPDQAVKLAGDFASGMRDYARELLGISDLDDRVRELAGPSRPGVRARPPVRNGTPQTDISLREQGAELLRQSADVTVEDGAHPAYARILSELAPDEGRILRLLATEGPQPSVDVRSSNLIGVGSQLVAQGLNMIGAQAGARHVDRVPAYLNNLFRLGLIWFSHDPVDDPMRYQVIEAQPDAMEAIKSAGRAKTVHRSVHLTPFGKDFCDVCLPLDTTEIELLTEG
jgi:hypothetical protein